jgi:regulator of replication initiation timing
MIKDRMCREYLDEIERLERSIIELEEQINELKMQLRLKVEEANDLAIENANLRHKLELMEKREKYLMNILQKLKVPLVLVDEDEFEDIDVSE